MPLNEDLIGVNPKRVIECGNCHTPADISINQSSVELICPGCYRMLGNWMTTSEAVAAMTEFVTKAANTSASLRACKCVCPSTRNPFQPGPLVEHKPPIESAIHYHIRWSDSSLDWKPFPTKEEATKLATKIRKRNESYVIVERDGECERCKAFGLQSKA